MIPARATAIPLAWSPGDEPTRIRVGAALEPWLGTPYVAGQGLRGVAADCVGFACSLLDELLEREPTPRERLPRDAALNDPASARTFMRWMVRRYDPVEEVDDRVALPGDVLVTAVRGAGPGHVIVVGHEPRTTWQAGARQVVRSGWTLAGDLQILRHHLRLLGLRA